MSWSSLRKVRAGRVGEVVRRSSWRALVRSRYSSPPLAAAGSKIRGCGAETPPSAWIRLADGFQEVGEGFSSCHGHALERMVLSQDERRICCRLRLAAQGQLAVGMQLQLQKVERANARFGRRLEMPRHVIEL